MESPNYFLKALGLESYITNDPLPRVEMDNFELDSKLKSGDPIKQEAINDEVTQITANIQADDFFSSLELQSSSKTSSNMISLGFSNKLAGGIVTRSRSFSSTLHDTTKLLENSTLKPKAKGRPKKDLKKKRNEKLCFKRRIKGKGKNRKLQAVKKSDGKDKILMSGDAKKQNSNKLEETLIEKSLGFEKSKDEEDWILFNNLTSKKEIDDKMFENKPVLSNDLQNPVRRCTPELFSMNSILMNDGKDEVDNLLEVEDYDDSFLEEIEDFSYTPPRSHTGGKWKPGSLTIRTSPMLWQNQNWDSFLDDKHQDEEKRNRAETPVDSPMDSNKISVSGKSFAPPNTYTGGKWKPITPPTTHTGGKWKPITPPATHTGGKWKPSDFVNRPKKSDQDLISSVDSDHNWKYDSEREIEPPPTHTGGKWKPNSGNGAEMWKLGTSKVELEERTSSLSSGKWSSDSGKSTLDVLARCQSTSGKCLKTSGGLIQYYCSPCNRRLSSKKLYKKHVQSELHFKRVLQENELEFDSRSLKLFHGLFTQAGYKERGLGKRVIKRPELFTEAGREKKIPTLIKIRGKRVAKKEIIRCEVCKVKVPSYQLGKHLVSYYHSRRIQLNDPEQRKLILDNIHAIVKQAPYQCGTCKFYCNTHTLFKKHWALPVHKEMEPNKNQRFWCALCSFECETSRSMELHLDSNSHREVILAVNKSIPIVIRHKVIFNCGICFREFRFNRELIRHKKIIHGVENDKSTKFVCPICQHNCKNIKSLQRHILSAHKKEKIPYFCSICSEFFNTAVEAKIHRNSQIHKYKKLTAEGKNVEKVTLTRSCSYCEETLENITKLKAHLLERHTELLPKCIKCGVVFALSQEVSQHVKNNDCNCRPKILQNLSLEFNCESCSFSTGLKSEFLLHSAVHQKKSKSEKKISCPLCGSLFTQTSLSIHLRTHLKEKTYQCSVCFKGFVRKDRYINHMKMKHGSREAFAVLDVSGSKLEENKCEGEEPNKKKTEKRMEMAEEDANVEDKSEKKIFERSQICGDAKCKYVAKDLTDLENHCIFHIGPKMYQCPECPYSAKTNTIIQRHYMIHVDKRSFPCHVCSFKARHKAHLKRHLRRHTGAKPYKCPHCSYTCNILENLRKHVLSTKIHPGKKLYQCKFCNFDTNVSKDFKTHMFKNHKDEYNPAKINELAGIYNKEEDSKDIMNSAPVNLRVLKKTSKKVYPPALKKKVDLLTQKFSPIAPKPFVTSYSHSPVLNSKNTGNSVEDKRKILKMELEKLKNQIKPSPKFLRSYPSPADKEHYMKTTVQEFEDLQKKFCIRKTTSNLSPVNQSDVESGVVLVNVMPTVTSLTEELSSSTIKTDSALQQKELSSACILYDNVLPSEEKEMYLLEDYQV